MNRTLRSALAAFFVIVTAFGLVAILRHAGRSVQVDLTERKLYTLSDGTKGLLKRLKDPVKVKLFYSQQAVSRSRDWIKKWHNHFLYVRDLLRAYEDASGGKFQLEILDPRPFSEELEQVDQKDQLENPSNKDAPFVLCLKIEGAMGQTAKIGYLDPDRVQGLEYEVTSLIDSIVTLRKQKLGILSPLPVMGGMPDMNLMMMGQEGTPPWGIVSLLQRNYEVSAVRPDVEKIEDVDLLMVIHPKDLPERTLFAIDQFVMNGGRLLVFVDPFCAVDMPRQRNPFGPPPPPSGSNLNRLLSAWGVEMSPEAVVVDYATAPPVRLNDRVIRDLRWCKLDQTCMNSGSRVTSSLTDVLMVAPGELKVKPQPGVTVTPLLHTTPDGRSLTGAVQVLQAEDALVRLDDLNAKAAAPAQPPTVGCLIQGRLKSAFPNGIELMPEPEADGPPATPTPTAAASAPAGAPASMPGPKRVTGLTEAKGQCVVAVFSDVDMLVDQVLIRVAQSGIEPRHNLVLVFNALDALQGSDELLTLRSRDSFRRPFDRIDAEEKKAQKNTDDNNREAREEMKKLVDALVKAQQEQAAYDKYLQLENETSSRLEALGRKIRVNERARIDQIERLSDHLMYWNVAAAPAATFVLAVALAVWRVGRRWHFARRRRV